MKHTLLAFSLLAMSLCACSGGSVKTYTTTADQRLMFAPAEVAFGGDNAETTGIITLDPSVTYQQMEGFGAAVTGSSCYNLLQMTPENRAAILRETFDPVEGMGYSYIRVSIGCSDFSMEDYTCCDEPGIENFAMHELDKRDLYPILREILAINPGIRIMGSPWTCPRWMKVDNLTDLNPYESWTSGQLNPKYYQDYAAYFVKWVQEMEFEGFPIESVTVQNEPLNRGNSASLYMTWQEQRDFIRDALGPAFRRAGLDTKIICFDHNYNYDINKPENADQWGYPLKIYEDPEAAQYVDGAAYHAYGGEVSEMGRVHGERPDKNLYFTEMSIGEWGRGYDFGRDLMWNMREVCLGTINRFCKAVIMWNYMLDYNHAPYRPGGCGMCLGAIDIDPQDYVGMRRNSHYYTMAHLSKVIDPGAFRIGSSGETPEGIHYSAFVNPDGSRSVVLLNDGDAERRIGVRDDRRSFVSVLPPRSVTSCRWNP